MFDFVSYANDAGVQITMVSAALEDSKANKSRHENINQSQKKKGETPSLYI